MAFVLITCGLVGNRRDLSEHHHEPVIRHEDGITRHKDKHRPVCQLAVVEPVLLEEDRDDHPKDREFRDPCGEVEEVCLFVELMSGGRFPKLKDHEDDDEAGHDFVHDSVQSPALELKERPDQDDDEGGDREDTLALLGDCAKEGDESPHKAWFGWGFGDRVSGCGCVHWFIILTNLTNKLRFCQ